MQYSIDKALPIIKSNSEMQSSSAKLAGSSIKWVNFGKGRSLAGFSKSNKLKDCSVGFLFVSFIEQSRLALAFRDTTDRKELLKV